MDSVGEFINYLQWWHRLWTQIMNFFYESQEKMIFDCLMHFQSSSSKYLDPVQVHPFRAPIVVQEHAFLGFISFCFLCLVLYFLVCSILTGTKCTCRGTRRLGKSRDGVRMNTALLWTSLGLGHNWSAVREVFILALSFWWGRKRTSG